MIFTAYATDEDGKAETPPFSTDFPTSATVRMTGNGFACQTEVEWSACPPIFSLPRQISFLTNYRQELWKIRIANPELDQLTRTFEQQLRSQIRNGSLELSQSQLQTAMDLIDRYAAKSDWPLQQGLLQMKSSLKDPEFLRATEIYRNEIDIWEKPMERIRVVVADDHPVVREGLIAIINAQPDMLVVAAAENGVEAVEAYRTNRPDVLLLDLVMPKMSGQDAIGEIRKTFRDARIIVMTSFQGEEDIYRALHGGARAYLQKESPPKVLLETIRAVHAGERRIPSEIAERLAARIPSSDLTTRESDVLKLIVNGLSNKEIAAQLHTTEGTIKGYVSNILIKLGVSDRTQAATAAIQRGIIHLEQ